MNAENIINALVHFFNDVIGAIIPGLILILGICLVHNGAYFPDETKFHIENGSIIFIFILLSYATGHGLLGLRGFLLKYVLRKEKAISHAKNSDVYKLFRKACVHRLKNKISGLSLSKDELENSLSFFDFRNIAMTICKEAGDLARRFMFISLLNYGISTALLIVAIYYGTAHFPCPFEWSESLKSFTAVFLMIFISIVFNFRGLEFERRAYMSPFSVALSDWLLDDKKARATGNDE